MACKRGGCSALTKARVLLVEDEPFIREVLAEVLLEADLEVTEAGDGGEALALLNGQDGFDLLLTDVHMPGCIDGVAVALHARALQPRLLVVFATGRPEALGAFGRLGPREVCLAKPFRPSEALSIVQRLLAERPHP